MLHLEVLLVLLKTRQFIGIDLYKNISVRNNPALLHSWKLCLGRKTSSCYKTTDATAPEAHLASSFCRSHLPVAVLGFSSCSSPLQTTPGCSAPSQKAPRIFPHAWIFSFRPAFICPISHANERTIALGISQPWGSRFGFEVYTNANIYYIHLYSFIIFIIFMQTFRYSEYSPWATGGLLPSGLSPQMFQMSLDILTSRKGKRSSTRPLIFQTIEETSLWNHYLAVKLGWNWLMASNVNERTRQTEIFGWQVLFP